MAAIAGFLGAFTICTLLTAGGYRLLRRVIPHWFVRVLVASVATLSLATVLGGYGLAMDKSNPVFLAAFQQYALPQVAAFLLWTFLSYGEK